MDSSWKLCLATCQSFSEQVHFDCYEKCSTDLRRGLDNCPCYKNCRRGCPCDFFDCCEHNIDSVSKAFLTVLILGYSINSWWPKIVYFGELFQRTITVTRDQISENFFCSICSASFPLSSEYNSSGTHGLYQPQFGHKVDPSDDFQTLSTLQISEKLTQRVFLMTFIVSIKGQ